MKEIKINGGAMLTGKIKISGAKNSVVALIPAAVLATGKCTITNVPNITDRDALFNIIKELGATIDMTKDVICIDTTNIENKVISEKLSNQLRASYYFMGVLLAKYKHVEIYFPGGCNIGARPIDIHLAGFEALGATIKHDEEDHKYIIDAKKLKGAKMRLKFASVGATINIMFAATMAEGTTIIENAAKETEIINIADFLNAMGAKIKGAGTSKITIEGVKKMHPANIEVIPDRIEAGTYLLMGALMGKDLEVSGIIKKHISSLLKVFDLCGVKYKITDKSAIISKCDHIKPLNVESKVYPGFPTDLGQPLAVFMTQCEGTSVYHETIWENRMGHIEHLVKMGANIDLKDNRIATIKGKTDLHGTVVSATDLRAGAALVMAGLIAKGTTTITNIEYILRGYEKIIEKLKKVGADIKVVDA